MSKSEFGSSILECEVMRMCGFRLRCFTKSTAYHILYLKWAEHWPHANIRISIQLDFLRLPFLSQNSQEWTSWGASEDNNLYFNEWTNNVLINPSIRLNFLNRISNMIQQVLYLLLLQEFIIKTQSPRANHCLQILWIVKEMILILKKFFVTSSGSCYPCNGSASLSTFNGTVSLIILFECISLI